MIKNPNPPSSLGITDFGFIIPWASVLLELVFIRKPCPSSDNHRCNSALNQLTQAGCWAFALPLSRGWCPECRSAIGASVLVTRNQSQSVHE